MKKAYDLLQHTPDLFRRDDAFVLLGVGKNMAQSIRFWGRVCGMFAQVSSQSLHQATPLGRALLADDGWAPFLVTPASHWLLHWQIAARPEAALQRTRLAKVHGRFTQEPPVQMLRTVGRVLCPDDEYAAFAFNSATLARI